MPTSLVSSLLYFQALAKMSLVHGLVLVLFSHARLVDIHQASSLVLWVEQSPALSGVEWAFRFQIWVEQAFRPAVEQRPVTGFSR